MPEGTSADLTRAAIAQEVTCVVSEPIVLEWRQAVRKMSVRDYFLRRNVPLPRLARLVEDMVDSSVVVVPTGEAPPCRDENDRKYLHCAIAGNADYLVTTDLDLLVLERIEGTRIIRPGALWKVLQR